MQIKDVMSSDVAMLSPKDTVEKAAEMMRSRGVGCLPVCQDQHICGVVTDRDLVTRVLAGSGEAGKLTVGDVMSDHVSVATPAMDVDAAARLMASRQVRRLPVVDDQQVVGMVSLGDLATKCYALQTNGLNVLAEISQQQ